MCKSVTAFAAVTVVILASVKFESAHVSAANSESASKYRLASHVRPLNYDLSLEPKLNRGTVSGRMIATIVTSRSIAAIELNVNQVVILGTPLLSGRPAINVTYDNRVEKVTLTFAESIPPGIWELSSSFESRINTALSGVFKVSAPPRSSASPEVFVATHFEPTDARKAFPCWDEPAFKATFDLTLIVPSDKQALSNTPVLSKTSPASSDRNPAVVMVKFARTPLMSTYLLAFVIGRFDQPLETVDSNGVRVSVYAPIGRRKEGEFAFDIANRTLPHFARLFGADYSLKKLDLVSLPDFPSIAMENWGLVLCHEPNILVSSETDYAQRAFIGVTVIHELAHQWFGNLVTPAWWSDLWLNEGFATWLSFHSMDEILPGFNSRDQFVGMEKLAAMRDDALEASHPIEARVVRPEDAAEVFDSISYGKGAALVGMLHDWLGNERFFAGLRRYIGRHRFANADTADLWRALQEELGNSGSEPSVADVMRDWTTRKGFPTIRVSVEQQDPDDQSSGCVARLTQSRYRLPGSDRLHDRWLWRIPIVVATQDGDIVRRVMSGSRMTLQLPSCGWLMLNPNATGFYRTAYSRNLRSILLREASNGAIGPAGRLTLLDDVFALHAADRVWAEDAMHAVNALRYDPSLNVWISMLNHLYSIGMAVQSRDGKTYQNWLRYIHGLCFERLRIDTSGRGRSVLSNCLEYARDDSIVSWAVTMFPRWLNGTRPMDVPPDVWDLTCGIAARNGIDLNNFWSLLSALNTSESMARRESIISCLGAFEDRDQPEIENRLVALALGDELQASEVLRLVDGFSAELVWRLLTRNWSTLARRLEGPYMLKRLIGGLTFRSTAAATRIRKFFRRHTAIGVRDAVRRQAEEVTLAAERISKDRVEMRFLTNRVLGVRGSWRRLGWN